MHAVIILAPFHRSIAAKDTHMALGWTRICGRVISRPGASRKMV